MRKTVPTLLAAAILVGGCAGDPQAQMRRDMMDRNAGSADVKPNITAETHFAAGQVAESQGNFKVAIERYTDALKLDPDCTKALFGLAMVRTRMGDYDQAIAAWERCVKASSEDPLAWSNLGYCYELAGKANEAEVSYQRALQRDPENPNARVNYGLMMARQDRIEGARAMLSGPLAPAAVEYNIGSIYEKKGDIGQARECFIASLRFDPNFEPAKTRLLRIQQTHPGQTSIEG